MQIHRVVYLVIVLFLAGCSEDEIKQLKKYNQQLQIQINQLKEINQEAQAKVNIDYGKRQAEIDQAVQQVGVSQGCRFLINVCPASITAPGDAAMAAGYGGGGTVSFWAIYAAKALFIWGVFCSGIALWTRQLRPDLTAQRLAGIELDQARKALKETEFAASEANQEHQKIEKTIQTFKQILNQLDVDIFIKEEELAAAVQSVKVKKADIDALNSFKF